MADWGSIFSQPFDMTPGNSFNAPNMFQANDQEQLRRLAGGQEGAPGAQNERNYVDESGSRGLNALGDPAAATNENAPGGMPKGKAPAAKVASVKFPENNATISHINTTAAPMVGGNVNPVPSVGAAPAAPLSMGQMASNLARRYIQNA